MKLMSSRNIDFPFFHFCLCQLAKTIALPSKERITEELIKLLESKKPSLGLNALIKSGLGERILPGLNQISQRDIEAINKLEIDLRLAYLLKELDIEICLSNLRLSKQQEQWIKDLIRCDGDRKKACFQKKDLSLLIEVKKFQQRRHL